MDGGAGMKPKKQWDHKWYTEEFLQQLKATAAVEMDGDLPYITKYAPVRQMGLTRGCWADPWAKWRGPRGWCQILFWTGSRSR